MPVPHSQPTSRVAHHERLDWPRAAYVHVPFCVHRCGYCDFTVVAGRDDLVERYLDALEQELHLLGDSKTRAPFACDTLFIGGGTPTYLEPHDLERLLAMLQQTFQLAPGGEWSIEANPFGLTDERLEVLMAAGVNRISLGVQAFDSAVLETLERDHSPEVAVDAIERSLQRFPNTAVDLIFGVPGQSMDSWMQSLSTVIDLGVPHVSCYGLTFEKGTSFWSRRDKGGLIESDEGLQRSMYAAAMDRLPAARREQYELSNYALAGFESRHNENYWVGGEYFGVGPGAASLVQGLRRTNHRSTTTWIKRVEQGQSPVMDEEPFDPILRGEELLMTALRRRDGLSLPSFHKRVGQALESFAPGAIAHCTNAGWLTGDSQSIRLTREGRFMADTVIGEFFTRSATPE